MNTRCAVRMKKMHWTDSEFDRTYFLYNIYLFSDYKKIHWTDFHSIWFGSILPDLITFSKFCINLLTVTFGVLLHGIPGNQSVNQVAEISSSVKHVVCPQSKTNRVLSGVSTAMLTPDRAILSVRVSQCQHLIYWDVRTLSYQNLECLQRSSTT